MNRTNPAAPGCRVLVVDDNPDHRLICRTVLECEDGIEWIGEAVDGHDGVGQARRLRPDVVVLDLRMPVLDGIATLVELRRELPNVGVVVWTNEDEPRCRLALDAGAHVVVSKLAPVSRLVRAIAQVRSR